MVKTAKRIYKRRTRNLPRIEVSPFVVYVTFPSGGKEYAYLCKDPSVRQGSFVVANGTEVQVRRTASHDPLASKFVFTKSEFDVVRRRNVILNALADLEKELAQRDRWKALAARSPEARRLLKELESL